MKRCADERQWLGLLRSVLIYHGIPFRRRRLTQFYNLEPRICTGRFRILHVLN